MAGEITSTTQSRRPSALGIEDTDERRPAIGVRRLDLPYPGDVRDGDAVAVHVAIPEHVRVLRGLSIVHAPIASLSQH